MPGHWELAVGEIHVPYNWAYADAAARTGATGFVAGDVGKLARQLDNDSFWILTATAPTWVQIGGTATDTNAIHKNVSAEISTITEKTLTTGDDLLVMEDSAASFAKKKLKLSNLPSTPVSQLMYGLEMEAGTLSATKVRIYEGIATSIGGTRSIEVPRGEYRDADLSLSGAGGLDTGSAANNTWYGVFLIMKEDGTVSAMVSLSTTSPTMPAGYVYKRHIGYLRNNVAAIHPAVSTMLGSCRKVCFRGQYTALSGGTATSWTDVDLSSWYSPWSRLTGMFVMVEGTATETVYLRPKGSSITDRTITGFKASQTTVEMMIGTDRTIQYQCVAGASCTIQLNGYMEKIY